MDKRKINRNIITNNINKKIHQKSSQGSLKSTSNRPPLIHPPPAWLTKEQHTSIYDNDDESDDDYNSNSHNKNPKISSNRNRNRNHKKHPIEFGEGFTSDEEAEHQGDIDIIDLAIDSDSDHNQSKLRNQSRGARRSRSAGPPSPPRNPNRKSNRNQSNPKSPKVKKSEDLVGSESVEFINKLSEGAIVTNMSLLCGRFPKQQKKLQHIVREFYRKRMSDIYIYYDIMINKIIQKI